MPRNSLVQARIDRNVKERATVVLESLGLTLSDAVRILLTRRAKEGTLPFELTHDGRLPSKLTFGSKRWQKNLSIFRRLAVSADVDGTRELVITGTPFVAAYNATDEPVCILRILHGSHAWPDELAGNWKINDKLRIEVVQV